MYNVFFQLTDNARFTATRCSFEYIEKGRAVVIETEKTTRLENIEVERALTNVSLENISLNQCKFSNNETWSVTLRPKDTAALTHTHVDAVVEGPASKTEVMEL